MPIVAADLVARSSTNMPEDDTSLVSVGADARTGVGVFRTASGIKVTQAFTLNGATEVVVAGGDAERAIRVTMDTTSGTRTVSVKQGAGGTVRGTIRPNETTTEILFPDSVSEAAGATRFSKVFYENTHGSLALTSAAVKMTADPSAKYRHGVAATKGDTATIANRKTVPGGITFVDDNVSQAVPTGSLASGEEIGDWIEQALLANDPPTKTTVTLELSGATT
jgi:hypothetical protein